MHRTCTGLFALLLCVGPYPAVYAQTADDVTAAQRQATIAQSQRDIAQANADEAKAKIGTLDTSGLPKGTGEATSLNVEGKILAYRAADRIAAKIATNVAALVPKPTSVVIYSQQELGAVQQYRVFLQQAKVFHNAVERAAGTAKGKPPSLPDLGADHTCTDPRKEASPPAKQAEAGGGVPPLLVVGTALEVLSLFKTDKKITGIDVEVPDFALAADVADKLIKQGLVVVYPPTFPYGAFSDPGATKSEMFKQYDALSADSTNLDIFLGLVSTRRDAINKLAKTKGVTDSCKKLFAGDLATLGKYEAAAKTLKTTVDQGLTALLKADDKTGTTPLQTLVAAENLATHFKVAPYILQLKAIAAGGATMTKTNLFTTHFYFSGGAVVSYLLVNGDSGDVVLAGTLPTYGGFVKSDELDHTE